MDHRVLEISYELDTQPGRSPVTPADPRVKRFRDDVMATIDAVLSEDGLGHALGAVLDEGRLALRFVVMDFDAAEARVAWTLDETPWGTPAEVLRYWDARAVA